MYFEKYASVLRIDFLYYLKLLVNPIDQILDVTSREKDIVSKLYRAHTVKARVCFEIETLDRPIIV